MFFYLYLKMPFCIFLKITFRILKNVYLDMSQKTYY